MRVKVRRVRVRVSVRAAHGSVSAHVTRSALAKRAPYWLLHHLVRVRARLRVRVRVRVSPSPSPSPEPDLEALLVAVDEHELGGQGEEDLVRGGLN